MIQRKFLCKDIDSANDAIGSIGSILSGTPHKCALVTFYEKGFSKQEVEILVSSLKACGSQDLKIAGITSTLIAELMPEGTGMLLNLILTDEADIDVFSIPCVPGEEIEAAGLLRTKLDGCDHVKAVELFGSNMAINTTKFMQNAMEGHEDAVLFGTTTIRNLMQKISVEESDNGVEIEKIDQDTESSEFVVGNKVMYDGFVAVAFSGKKLRVHDNYALGWNPIGRSFEVELGDEPSMGETVVKSINGRPAVEIYKEYLGVYPDSFFVTNVCEFPFMVERDGINICLIPIFYGKDGELFFMMTLEQGEKLRFSFASHDEVLYASRESLYDMERFGPEALFLTLCGNRINFLKEDAHIEWDGFDKFAPDRALMHGACELYYHNKKGGILNSAHLAIGLKEGDEAPKNTVSEQLSLESLRHGRPLSLSDRMSVFLSTITTELIDMAVKAQDANNAKSVFLSHMSHEIRTPINAIIGMDEMILKESKEDPTLEYADSIRSAGNNLLGIINDILDFSKIEAGKMNIIPVEYDLRTLVKDLYNVVRLRAKDKGLDVKLDIDPTLPVGLVGDETRIRQVITNLLTNAVKYTETGTVTLIMQKEAEGSPSDNSICISMAVKDTGIGIRPEDMEKLFDEYERAEEKRNRKIEGTGLGLSITRELLELMGSALTVDSTYGEGSQFGFVIMQDISDETPVDDVNGWLSKPVEKKSRIGFTAEDARILVVDDTLVNITVIRALLKENKMKIDSAGSGKDALELVKQHKYDVILLDHEMPEMDGPQTLKMMKELDGNLSADTPVISLTANASADAREEYIRAGYNDYLPKPIHPEELYAILYYYIAPEKIRTVTQTDE